MTCAARCMKRAPADGEQTVCFGGWSSVSVESDCKRSAGVDVPLICCKDLGATYVVPQVFKVQVLATQVLLEVLLRFHKGFQRVDRAKNGVRLHTAGYRYFNPRNPRCILWISESSNNFAMCIVGVASKRFGTASTLLSSTSCIFQDLVRRNAAASPVSPQALVQREDIIWLCFKLLSSCTVGTGCRRRRNRAESLPESSADRRLCCRRCFSGLVTPEPCPRPPLIARAERGM